ncbi:hypothetical protein [Acetatifactor muris]|uniref:hypothetical protein n=1 Tax=Acetatifactor muris TaxID=879566 RepID=UPI0023EF6C4D|nr:hypothetical protein [Acetatifactor muris]
MKNEDLKEIFSGFDALIIKEKAEAAISLAEQYNVNAAQSGAAKFSPVNRIRLDRGIETVAEALDRQLQRFRATSGNYVYYFNYKGWEFSQVSEEELAVCP